MLYGCVDNNKREKGILDIFLLFSIGKTFELIIIRCNIRVTTIEKKRKEWAENGEEKFSCNFGSGKLTLNRKKIEKFSDIPNRKKKTVIKI